MLNEGLLELNWVRFLGDSVEADGYKDSLNVERK